MCTARCLPAGCFKQLVQQQQKHGHLLWNIACNCQQVLRSSQSEVAAVGRCWRCGADWLTGRWVPCHGGSSTRAPRCTQAPATSHDCGAACCGLVDWQPWSMLHSELIESVKQLTRQSHKCRTSVVEPRQDKRHHDDDNKQY